MLQLLDPSTPPVSTPDAKGVRLPKIDVPTFNGHILTWKTFWEQYSITGLTSPMLRSFRHSGSAKGVIKGLSRSGEQYQETIESLQALYNRPHQAHVRKILEVSSLKEGSGHELRCLHDVVQQHLRALKSMDYEPSSLQCWN